MSSLTPQQKQAILLAYPELAPILTQEENNETLNNLASRSKLPPELIAKIKAVKGDKGDKGDAFVGSQGEKGDAGKDGKDGRDGVDGEDGKDGAVGPKGERGEIGPRGERGIAGKDGKDAPIVDTSKLLEPLDKKIEDGMAKVDGRIKLIDQRWGAHGGGLSKVITDATLTGNGTGSSPLSVVSGAGTGDVVGPASSVDNSIVRFDSTTGKLIQGYTSNTPTISDDGIISAYRIGINANLDWDLTVSSGTGQGVIALGTTAGNSQLIGRASAFSGGTPSDLGFGTRGNFYFLALDGGVGNVIIASGSLGITGTRVSKGWFTNLEVTNAPTLGGVAIPSISSTSTLTNKRVTPRIYTTDSIAGTPGVLTPEIDTYDYFEITAQAAALNIANHSTSTPTGGEKMIIAITSDATPRALTYGTNYVAKAGVALPSTTVASKTSTLGFQWNAGLGKWNLLAVGQEA